MLTVSTSKSRNYPQSLATQITWYEKFQTKKDKTDEVEVKESENLVQHQIQNIKSNFTTCKNV